MEPLTCSSCDDSNVNLYSCECCAIDSDECSNDIQKELLCDLCVASHVKKGHDVKTAKGQVPVMCETHKILHTLYCKTCDVTYCTKCSKIHSQHELGDIEERVAELKKKVFEILTEFELDEKPLRAKKESIIEQKVCHDSEQNQLKERFLEEMEKLKEAGLKVIEKNSRIFSEKEQKVVEVIDKVVEMQQSARNLLCHDNSMLIKDFGQLQDLAVKCRTASEMVLAEDYAYNSCNYSDFVKDLSDIMSKLMPKLETRLTAVKSAEGGLSEILNSEAPLGCIGTKRLTTEHYAYKLGYLSFDESNYEITTKYFSTHRLLVKNGNLTTEEVIITYDGKIFGARQKACLPFDKEIKALYFNDEMSILIVRSARGFILINENVKSKLYEAKSVDFEVFEGFLCAYIYNDQIHQCYWKSAEKQIHFSHNNASFKCHQAPKLLSSQTNPFVCLLTDENNIFIYCIEENEHYNINFTVHQIELVDHVCLHDLDELKVYIWSNSSKSVTKLKDKRNRIQRVKKFCWSCPTQPLVDKSETPPHVLLPAVADENSDLKSSYHYVYAVLQGYSASER